MGSKIAAGYRPCPWISRSGRWRCTKAWQKELIHNPKPPPKFNSSPLNNGGWKTTLSLLGRLIFRLPGWTWSKIWLWDLQASGFNSTINWFCCVTQTDENSLTIWLAVNAPLNETEPWSQLAGEWSDMAAEQQLALRTAASKGPSQMHKWAVQCRVFLATFEVETCLRFDLNEHLFFNDCWKMCQIYSSSHHFAGETVLHFRARGFPYEIDIKAHVRSCFKESRVVLETRDRCKLDAWRHEDTLPVGVKAKRYSSLGELWLPKTVVK